MFERLSAAENDRSQAPTPHPGLAQATTCIDRSNRDGSMMARAVRIVAERPGITTRLVSFASPYMDSQGLHSLMKNLPPR